VQVDIEDDAHPSLEVLPVWWQDRSACVGVDPEIFSRRRPRTRWWRLGPSARRARSFLRVGTTPMHWRKGEGTSSPPVSQITWVSFSPDNVHETGASPDGQSRSPTAAA
jgi:hypothetical protein